MMKGMSSRLMSEWMAFFMLEQEDRDKDRLENDAVRGLEEMRNKRR